MTTLEVFARTEVGCVRERNEDVFVVANLDARERSLRPIARRQQVGAQGALVAVCDGMGGTAGGQVAANLAADALVASLVEQERGNDSESISHEVAVAFASANASIRAQAQVQPALSGMGSTMTVLLALPSGMWIGHVGDSRCYLLREGKLVQLTRDDSLVSHLVARGQLTSDEARVFRYRNVLLQALGVQENLAVQIVALTPKVGDRFLLCSDGLNACLEDDAIADLLALHSEPMICCRKLTERVCALGAPDNVTVALVSVLAGDEGTSPHDTEQATSWERRVIDI